MSMGHKSHAKSPKAAMGLDLQSSNYGSCLPVLFGQNKIAPIVGWYSDFKAIPHKQKQQGSKGGGSQSTTSYTYQASWMHFLCEGTATIVNVLNGTDTKPLSSYNGVSASGTYGQAPWSHLTGTAAIGYSLTAWAAYQNYDLGDNPSLPNFNYEMAGKNQYSSTIKDANPADIVTAICTDTYIGVHFNALGDLTQFSNYCQAAGIFFSPYYNTQQQASQPLDDIFKYANSAAFFSEGVLKVVPYGDSTITGNGVTYTPNLTAVADLGPNDFITNGSAPPVTAHRKAPADARNIHRIEFKDRANSYHSNAVQASIDQDINSNGARSDNSDSVDMITQASIARLVAQNLVQRDFYVRNTYEFQLSWRYCWLEPMDIVTLTDSNTGLNLTPVRVTEITEDENGLLSIVAEEMPDGIGHGGSYGTQSNLHVPVNQNADPGPVDGPYFFRAPGFLVSAGAPEIWIALNGDGQYWAGCHVYMSTDNASFEYLATFARKSTYGYITNPITAGTDLDNVNVPNVILNGGMTLRGGNTTDRDEFNTMSMIDTEVISYQTATLAAGPSYNLGSLRRGGFGTAMASHAANAPFVRLDENIFRMPINPSQVGKTVYFKFLSFNCFGMGGRTLASETSYSYVIGSNVEFPDVAPTPSSFTSKSVTDGVNLTWVNSNPAAVGCTSIEYSTTGTGGWSVLAQVGPTTTGYHHAFKAGLTYYYRIRARGFQVSGGWSAYSPVISSKGSVKSGSFVSATQPIADDVGDFWYDTANNVVRRWDGSNWLFYAAGIAKKNLIVNPTAMHDYDGWTGWIGSGRQRMTTTNESFGKAFAVDFADATNTYDMGASQFIQTPGAGGLDYTLSGRLFAFHMQAGGSFTIEARFYNSSGTEISTSSRITLQGSVAVNAQTYVNGTLTAPTGTTQIAVIIRATGKSDVGVGSLNRWWDLKLEQSSWPTPFTDDATAKVSPVDVYNDTGPGGAGRWRIGLRVPGSGHRLGDTRNAPGIMVGNGAAKVPTSISWSSSFGTPCTATISVAAFTMLTGSVSVAYNAASVGVTGSGGSTVTYYLYWDDPGLTGGSKTLVATTNGNAVWQGDDRIYIGSVSVTYPTVSGGSGSGSGSGGGGPNSCVCIDQWLEEGFMAMEAKTGDLIDCIDIPKSLSGYRAPILGVRFAETECVRLTTSGGAKLDLSATTPFDLLDGRTCEAELMKDEYVVTDKGIERVVSVLPLGMQPVARISVGGVSYAAGHDPKYRIYSHNTLKP